MNKFIISERKIDMYIKRKARRISVWGIIFIVLLAALGQAALPCSAKIIDGARNAVSDAGDKISEAASDIESKADEMMSDVESKLDDASDGKVEDSDGLIGNDETAAPEKAGMGKVGQVALIVLAVAAIITVIIIITLVSHKNKKTLK